MRRAASTLARSLNIITASDPATEPSEGALDRRDPGIARVEAELKKQSLVLGLEESYQVNHMRVCSPTTFNSLQAEKRKLPDGNSSLLFEQIDVKKRLEDIRTRAGLGGKIHIVVPSSTHQEGSPPLKNPTGNMVSSHSDSTGGGPRKPAAATGVGHLS